MVISIPIKKGGMQQPPFLYHPNDGLVCIRIFLKKDEGFQTPIHILRELNENATL